MYLAAYICASATGRFCLQCFNAAARPSKQAWVANTAAKYKNKEATESSIKATQDFNALGSFTSTDINALCFLVMVQVAKNNERVSKKVLKIKT
jgi:hypothetical protein